MRSWHQEKTDFPRCARLGQAYRIIFLYGLTGATDEREPDQGATVTDTAGNTMRSVAWVALIAPARGRASKEITNIMHTGAARFLWKPNWPWVKTKPPKPAKPLQPSTTGRAVCNARFLLREVHVSGALSGACTGKGPQMANPRPTPKPGNLGPPWPLCTSGNMSSTCSVLPRDLVSVEVAAEQVGAHPQTLLTRSTFPVHYPVRAPGKGPQMANARRTPKPGNLGPPWPLPAPGQPCRLFPRQANQRRHRETD